MSRNGSEVDLPGIKPTSPTALSHLGHLDIPRADSPSGGRASSDFATGYSLGLIGGVRSWMTKSKVSLRGSQPGSPDSSDEDSSDMKSPDTKSPVLKNPTDEKTPSRGRKDARSGDAMDMV